MNTPVTRNRPEMVRPGNAAGIGARPGAITASQRAAVIISLLGEAAAKPIVEKLDDVALAKVITALETISMLSREELAEIVIDFIGQLRQNSGAMRGGAAKAREVLSGIVDANRLSLLYGNANEASNSGAEETGDVWARLCKREPRLIAEYVGRLSPNIIAMILRKLDAGMASSILCLLPDEKLSPTLGQMVDSPKVDPGIDSVIERMIEIEFLNNKEEEGTDAQDAYLETIGEVLSLIPDSKRDSLVSFLRSEHETKLEIIQKGLFTIEALPDILARNSVPVVFKEIEPAVLIKLLASLREDYSAVSQYLLGNISSRLADSMREEIKDVPSMQREVAGELQREFLTSLMGLKRRGLITMNRPPPQEA
ncbi:MAG: FliG C-terminal domain-containing protein [Hyphomonas sp.]|uniref:FliG C-terminal domain-containing protein n=1 Tax=Hyphomonas sp. TaxID=87 RepID=UPI0034A016AA